MSINQPPYNDFQEIKIRKGSHRARPYWFDYGRRERLALQFMFTDYARYQLPGVDQQDWNKLCGVSFNLFTNHKNSAMVSWRYNSDQDVFELGFYYHVRGERKIRKYNQESEVFARVPVAGLLRVYMDIDHRAGLVMTTIETEGDKVADAIVLPTRRRSRIINTWFGGNRAAPNDIYILRKQIT